MGKKYKSNDGHEYPAIDKLLKLARKNKTQLQGKYVHADLHHMVQEAEMELLQLEHELIQKMF